MTALRMIERGDIKARQPCPGAPWAIKAESVAPFTAKPGKKRPVTPNSSQQTFDFQ
jgi:hypothetical protein